MEGWMEGWMDGWKDGWMDGWMFYLNYAFTSLGGSDVTLSCMYCVDTCGLVGGYIIMHVCVVFVRYINLNLKSICY